MSCRPRTSRMSAATATATSTTRPARTLASAPLLQSADLKSHPLVGWDVDSVDKKEYIKHRKSATRTATVSPKNFGLQSNRPTCRLGGYFAFMSLPRL